MHLIYLLFCLFYTATSVYADLQEMPGTDLRTFTGYNFKLFSFPESHIVPSDERTNSRYQYVITDNNNASFYRDIGTYYASWIFQPFSGSQGGNEGWYEIHNWYYPGALSTSNTEDGDPNYMENKYFITVNTDYNPNSTSSDYIDRFLWKPRKITSSADSKTYYQLINKARPQGVFTYTGKVYKDRGYYMQLDNSGDSRYNKGGEWFNDSLVKIFQDV